ncbi:hypothetical protein [Streptomyces sp. NPDC002758]
MRALKFLDEDRESQNRTPPRPAHLTADTAPYRAPPGEEEAP